MIKGNVYESDFSLLIPYVPLRNPILAPLLEPNDKASLKLSKQLDLTVIVG